MPTTGAEQRWVSWILCLIRKWSCVNLEFQFHTQIAYRPTYMTRDLCYMMRFIYILHIIQSHLFGNPFFGTLTRPFHIASDCASAQWRSVLHVLVTCSPRVNKCWVTCHMGDSLGLKSLTHNYSTPAGPVRIRCVMPGMFNKKGKGRTSQYQYQYQYH